jgi:hypothetical protein
MTSLNFLSCALIVAALLATPVVARESHVSSRRLTENANACATTGARHIDGYPCYGNHAGGLRGHGDRDVWGHWGTYYGPMVPTVP